MSKAEDLAKELYPLLETDKIGNNPYITYNTEQLAKQEGFIEGYHQAEKDLELTWEHLKTLDDISDDVYAECDVEMFDEKKYYQEVLKRYKAMPAGVKDGDKVKLIIIKQEEE